MSTMLSDKSDLLGAGSGLGTSDVTVEVTEIPVGDHLGGVGSEPIASNTKQVLSDVGPALKADAEELKYKTEDYVIEHPIKAVAVALGVGFVLGVLWCRR